MREFKLDNVIKKTDNEVKIKKYLDMGFEEITETQNAEGDDQQDTNNENGKDAEDNQQDEPDYDSMKVDELKDLADKRNIEYDSKIKKDDLIELLGE